jgi:uroporphyrinogen-III synthase
VLVDPLLEIDQLPVPAIDLTPYQAVAITSRHALPALGRLTPMLPVFCVGGATAARVRALGIAQVVEGPGDAAGLAELMVATLRPVEGRILHVAGSETKDEPGRTLTLNGFEVVRLTTYRARAVRTLHPRTSEALARGRLTHVLLFSPRTASILMALSAGLELGRLQALCLSPDVALALDPTRLARVLIATRPDEPALLDLLEAPGHR